MTATGCADESGSISPTGGAASPSALDVSGSSGLPDRGTGGPAHTLVGAKATEELSTCGPYLVAHALMNDELYVWPWHELDEDPIRAKSDGEHVKELMCPKSIVTKPEPQPLPYEAPEKYVMIRSLDSRKPLKKWVLPDDWYCSEAHSSTNGKFVAVLLSHSGSPGEARYRVGVFGHSSEKITWAPEIRHDNRTLMLRHAVPEGRGRYVAAVGAKDGGWICVMDMAKEQTLWQEVPEKSVGFKDVAFSPDARTVYAGGGAGVVFVFDVANGQVKDRWLIGDGKEVAYGHRISRVAASPDGKYVAAGTGPAGQVYLWEASTGKRVATLETGQGTIMGLAFSPDSERLATKGVSRRAIEVRSVPEP